MEREPNLLELGIFSVMWSEHCSYKSTKKWLKILPTKGKRVICGPGENAGIIDILLQLKSLEVLLIIFLINNGKKCNVL